MYSLYSRFISGYIVTIFWNHYFSYYNLTSAVYDSSAFISSNTYSLNTCLKHPLWVHFTLFSFPTYFFFTSFYHFEGFPGGPSGKEPTCQCRRCKRCGFDPWVGMIPWRRAWQPNLVFLPREYHGQRSLDGYNP